MTYLNNREMKLVNGEWKVLKVYRRQKTDEESIGAPVRLKGT